MNKWGTKSKRVLAELNPDLQVLMNEVLRYYDISLEWGFRGDFDQNAAFASGASTKKWPNSKHNRKPSDAVDFTLKGANKEFLIFLAGFVTGLGEQLFRQGEIKRRVKSLGPTSLGDWGHVETRR